MADEIKGIRTAESILCDLISQMEGEENKPKTPSEVIEILKLELDAAIRRIADLENDLAFARTLYQMKTTENQPSWVKTQKDAEVYRKIQSDEILMVEDLWKDENT